MTRLFFCAVDVRSFRISSFCCAVSAMLPPLFVVDIQDFEELLLDDYAVMCFFNKVMFQAEFDDLVFFLLVKHLSFTSLKPEVLLLLIMVSVGINGI